MIELAKAIVFEVAYLYWHKACGGVTRPEYVKRLTS